MVADFTLGKYRILEPIGQGGFATVYRAEDLSLERTVALKVLDPMWTRDPSLISRFQQEAKVTAKLFHPNIAALFEVGAVDGRYFLAMQYITGQNLRDLLQPQSLLPLDQIATIIQQVGAALDYAHAQGIVHRDVKPSNIIVDDAGHATLTDFGIVKVFESTTLQTTSGAIFGTPAYSSPEQVESKPLDGRSDLYSLGIVAYELCTGKVPFAADTIPSLYYKIVHEAPLPPSQANARVVGPIEQVLLKAIAKQVDQRYPNGQAFAADLNAAVEKVNSEELDALYQQATTLSNQKDFDTAEMVVRQVLAIKPTRQDAATLLEQIRKRREAAKRYQELTEAADKLRAQADEFKQANPDMDDPVDVLNTVHRAEMVVPSSERVVAPIISLSPAAAKSTMPDTTTTSARAGWILLSLGLFTLYMGIWPVSIYIWGSNEFTWQVLSWGGMGSTLCGLVLLAKFIRPSVSNTSMKGVRAGWTLLGLGLVFIYVGVWSVNLHVWSISGWGWPVFTWGGIGSTLFGLALLVRIMRLSLSTRLIAVTMIIYGILLAGFFIWGTGALFHGLYPWLVAGLVIPGSLLLGWSHWRKKGAG